MTNSDTPMQATPEELCASTLKHYEELSTAACHWSNQVPQAIRFWYLEKPRLERELSALRRELTNMANKLADEIEAHTTTLRKVSAKPVAWIEHHKGGDNLVWEQTALPCSPLIHPPAVQPAPAVPAVPAGLPQSVLDFDAFLNEPPQYEDKHRVREYQHEAYPKWKLVLQDIRKLLTAAQEPKA